MLSRNPGIMRAVHVFRQVEAKKLGKHIGELKKRSFSATGVNRKLSFSFVDGRPNLVASRCSKMKKKTSLPVDVRLSETPLLTCNCVRTVNPTQISVF